MSVKNDFRDGADHGRRPSLRKALGGVGGTLAASWLAGSIGVRLARLTPNPGAEPEPPAEPLVLSAADGGRIAATYWPGARADGPAVLLIPGLGTLHRKLAANAAWLAARGYAVLAIDLRGHGRSSPAPHSFGWTESRDAHAAFAWLKARQQGAKIAVIGISMGGAAALVGPAGPVPADALVLQAVFASIRKAVRCRIALLLGWGPAWLLEPLLSFQARPRFGVWPGRIAPLAVVPRLRCPILVVGGARDPFVRSAELFAFHDAAVDPRGVWIARRLGHGGISDTRSEAYRSRILAFLRETIGA